MRKMRFFLAILSTLTLSILTGCASLPKAPEADDVQAKMFLTDPEKAHIYIYREFLSMGAIGNFKVFFDGQYVGDLAVKTYYLLKVEPGEHDIWGQAVEKRPVNLEAEAGKNYFVSIRVGGFSGPLNVVELVEPFIGMKAVEKCELLVPPEK